MTSMMDCPECGAALQSGWTETDLPGIGVSWKWCPICQWNERRQLQEKMYDETKNSPGP